MEEYGKVNHEDSTKTEDSGGKSSKRKSRALPYVGGVAASEGSIWQRDRSREEPARRQPLFETPKTPKAETEEPKQPREVEKTEPEPVIREDRRAEQAEIEEDERLSELTPDEIRQVALQYAKSRAAELAEEVTESSEDPETQAATKADAELIVALHEGLQANQGASPEEIIGQAYTETLEGLEAGTPDSGDEPRRVVPPDGGNVPPLSGSLEDHVGRAPGTPESPMPPQAPAGGNTGGNQPPDPPRGVGYPAGYPQWYPRPEAVMPAPAAADTDTIPRTEAAYYERQAENRGLLVGGVVGYLVGRRRGRIKSEKRLLPIQHKLEKRVTELHRTIADKERQVRTLAAQKARKARQAQPAAAVLAAERPKGAEPARVPLPKPASRYPEAPIPASLRQGRAPESLPFPVLPAPLPSRPELVHPDAAREVSPAVPVPQPERSLPAQPEYDRDLSTNEALELSKKIIIGGTSVHEMYQAKRITEPGLHRITHEYLRGGSVERALQQELLAKELTYERDPHMRDSVVVGAPARAEGGFVRPMLPLSAEADQHTQLPSPAAVPAPAAPPMPEPQSAPAKKSAFAVLRDSYDSERVITHAWVAIIILLAVIAVVLILK